MVSKFNVVGKERIFNIALYIADKVHPRAIDAYYIATAIIKAYYLIKEFDDLKKEI